VEVPVGLLLLLLLLRGAQALLLLVLVLLLLGAPQPLLVHQTPGWPGGPADVAGVTLAVAAATSEKR
jgi:hypothetical protein